MQKTRQTEHEPNHTARRQSSEARAWSTKKASGERRACTRGRRHALASHAPAACPGSPRGAPRERDAPQSLPPLRTRRVAWKLCAARGCLASVPNLVFVCGGVGCFGDVFGFLVIEASKQAQASKPREASTSKQAQGTKHREASTRKQAQGSKHKEASTRNASKSKLASASKQSRASKRKQAGTRKQAHTQASTSKHKQASARKQASASKYKHTRTSKQAQGSKQKQAITSNDTQAHKYKQASTSKPAQASKHTQG